MTGNRSIKDSLFTEERHLPESPTIQELMTEEALTSASPIKLSKSSTGSKNRMVQPTQLSLHFINVTRFWTKFEAICFCECILRRRNLPPLPFCGAVEGCPKLIEARLVQEACSPAQSKFLNFFGIQGTQGNFKRLGQANPAVVG